MFIYIQTNYYILILLILLIILINIINIKTALNILSAQSGYSTHFFVEPTKKLYKIKQCGCGDMWG